jgi:hypothetical protein
VERRFVPWYANDSLGGGILFPEDGLDEEIGRQSFRVWSLAGNSDKATLLSTEVSRDNARCS